MADLLPFIVIGLTVGSVYGLAATGLVLTYKTSGIFNFAYGALASVSVFVFYELVDVHGWPWPLGAVLCVLVLGPVMGILLELLTRQLAMADRTLQIAAMVGLILWVVSLTTVLFSNVSGNFPSFLPTNTVRIALRQRGVGADHHRENRARDDRVACTPSFGSPVAASSCAPSWTTPSSCPYGKQLDRRSPAGVDHRLLVRRRSVAC